MIRRRASQRRLTSRFPKAGMLQYTNMKEGWKQPAVMVSLLTLVGAGLRFWQLGRIHDFVFDEVYYAKWGQDYLVGNSFFDVHPPLGKLLIAVGIKIFGFTPFGWRFMPALFGVAVVPLTYAIAKRLFDQKIALLATLFVSLDGLLLVQSRTALLDSFQITFTLAAAASFLAYCHATLQRKANVWLILTGVFLGCLVATKWTGLAMYGLIVLFMVLWRHTRPRVAWLTMVASFLIIPAAIYLASFVWNGRTIPFIPYLVDWHQQAWNFHHTLTATHPYMSRWWSWLYLARPVWYYFIQSQGVVRGIIALGNPVLWWTAIPAFLAAIWTSRQRLETGLGFAVLAVLGFYLPWILISRTQFQYYIVPGVPFLMMILAWWLTEGAPTIRKPIIALAILAFAFWYPLLIGASVSEHFYRAHLWFRSWI